MMKLILNLLAILCGGSLLSSCSMMHEDRDDCPSGLYVRFAYDYNTLRADIFKDHVGHVQLYVFDEEGRLAAQRTISNNSQSSPLADYGYSVHFSEAELPAGHSYRLQAIGLQRDWDEALAGDGAKYRHAVSPSDHSESMLISLDRDKNCIAGTRQHAVCNDAPLDTLWHTLKVTTHEPQDGRAFPAIDRTAKPYSIYPADEQRVRVEHEKATYATVSLIRDTKHLTLTLRHVDTPETARASDYEVRILDNNAHLSHDNSVLTHDSLRYTPYASWTSRLLADNTVEIEDVHQGNPGQYHAPATKAEDAETLQRTAHFNVMFNRLMINTDDNADNASLEILDKQSGKTVAKVNLPYILSQGRQAYDIQNYGHQEYLDREHDYHLDFFLKGGEWVAVEIHVLSWSKRIQNIGL